MQDILKQLKGGLIVSCQAEPGTPTNNTDMIVAFALSAAMGGAVGLRLNGAEHTRAVRIKTNMPIISIQKTIPLGEPVLITGDRAEVPPLARSGADIIAFDATDRQRPTPIPELIAAIHDEGLLAMADLRSFEDAERIAHLPVDMLATTLSVWDLPAYIPNIQLIRQLAETFDKPVIAEGNFWTPDDVRRAFDAGAYAVVIGSAITRPWKITEYYVRATG